MPSSVGYGRFYRQFDVLKLHKREMTASAVDWFAFIAWILLLGIELQHGMAH